EITTFDDQLLEAITGDDAPPEGVAAVLLVDDVESVHPDVAHVLEGFDDLGGGLYAGLVTAGDVDVLNGAAGIRVSETLNFSATPVLPEDEPDVLEWAGMPGQDPLRILTQPEVVGLVEDTDDPTLGPLASPSLPLWRSWVTVPQVDPSLAATRTSLGLQGQG